MTRIYNLRFAQFVLFFVLFSSKSVFSIQDSTQSQIQISSSVNQTKIPLNRNLELKVTISWLGNSDRFDVINFDNPALTNFEIVGTSTTSRTEIDKVFKDYIYSLRPVELGMGYVEGVMLKAHDKVLDKDENLVTQRIPIEVIDPIPDPEETNLSWLLYVAIILVIGLVVAFFIWSRKKKKREKESLEEPTAPIESQYLDELKNQINLEQPNLNDDFTTLSKLLRRFLAEKFDIRALEVTTDELKQAFAETELEENQITNIKEILTRSDEIKFSGTEGSKEELSRFYTLIEGILEKYLRLTEIKQSEEEKKVK